MTAGVTKYGEPTDADATVIARREYSPYGLELTAEGLSYTKRAGVAPMSVFHGKELDRVTKFSSFGARSYSRDLGVWLRPDPIMSSYLVGAPNGGVFTSSNLSSYSYAHQRPTVANDPNGQWANVLGGAVVGGLIGGGVEFGRQLYVDGRVTSWGRVGAATTGGAVAGAIAGATMGASLLVQGGAAGVGSAAGATTTRAVLGEKTSATDIAQDALVGLVTFGVVKGGGTLLRSARGTAKETAEELTTLYRAVNPDELADIQAKRAFQNLGSAEGKYFTTSGEAASSYAKQAVEGFGDAPYTLVQTQVRKSVLDGLVPATVDRGIPAYVIPNSRLPGLVPKIMDSMPLPGVP
jgi:RHS repeat-associated protein